MRRRILALSLGLVLTLQTFAMSAVLAEAPQETEDRSVYESSLFASDSEEGNYPRNTIDGNLGTKWASQGMDQWIAYRLAEETAVEEIGFSFTNGDVRVYSFSVQVSMDMENWITVFEGKSCGTTTDIEMFKLNPVKAKFIRFVGRGSNVNQWNNINEVKGIELKKIPLTMTVDGRIENFVQEPIITDNEVFVCASGMLEDLGYEGSYDSEAQTLTATLDEHTLILDYKANRATLDGTRVGDSQSIMLTEEGAPLIRHDLIGSIVEAEVVYSKEDKTLEIVTDNLRKITEAYQKIDEEFLGILDWFVDIYDPESGGFYNTVSGAEYEGFYPSLEATGYIYQIMQQLGVTKNMPEEFKEKLIHFFQSSQDPDTGFFTEPWPKAKSYNDRDKMRVYAIVTQKLPQLGATNLYPLPSERENTVVVKAPSKIRIVADASELEAEKEAEEAEVQEESASQDAEAEAEVEVEELPEKVDEDAAEENEEQEYDYNKKIELPAGVPEYCATVNTFMAHIKGYTWENDTWSSGDKTHTDLSYILLLPEEYRQPYIDAALKFLEEQQQPNGYWASNGDIGFNAVSGAFKVIMTYNLLGVCPPNPMKTAETIIETLRSGDTATAACYVRNPISALALLMNFDGDVAAYGKKHEVEILTLYQDLVAAMFHEDGGASSLMYRSNTKFGGLRAGRTLCEGDVDGTLQMVIARNYLNSAFGRKADNSVFEAKSEEFWEKIMNKKPIVKKPYVASEGIVVEEDFEDAESIEDLFDKNWAFRSKNTMVQKEADGNTYLVANDQMPLDQDTWELAFDKIYGTAEINYRIMFDRDLPYQAKGNNISYSYLRVASDTEAVMDINALDYGTEKISLAMRQEVNGVSTYTHFATVNRGEWFDLKFEFYRQDGKLRMNCYFNGKLQPAIKDMLLLDDVEFIDSISGHSSNTRCSRIAVDDIKIISM